MICFAAEGAEVLPLIVSLDSVRGATLTVAVEVPVDTDLGSVFIEDRLAVVANVTFKAVAVRESLHVGGILVVVLGRVSSRTADDAAPGRGRT